MSTTDWAVLDRTIKQMSQTDRLELIERVVLSLKPLSAPPSAERQREARIRLMEKLDALPLEGPNDGFSGQDHDKILYGALQ